MQTRPRSRQADDLLDDSPVSTLDLSATTTPQPARKRQQPRWYKSPLFLAERPWLSVVSANEEPATARMRYTIGLCNFPRRA